MKKLLMVLCLCFCFLPVANAVDFSNGAGGSNGMGGGVAAGAGCTTSYHSSSGTGDTVVVGYDPAHIYVGLKTTDASSPAICRVDFTIAAVNGNISGISYQVEIHKLGETLGIDPPTSVLGTSDTVTAPTVGKHTFTFSSPVTLSGGSSNNYAIVMTRTDHSYNATNYIALALSTSDGDAGYSILLYWPSTGGYSNYSFTADCVYEIFK